MATGTRHIEQLGGLLRRMPWTGLCFLVGAAGDLRAAAPERLRQRVADVPGVPARVPRLVGAARPPDLPAGRRAAGADDRAGGRLLREGVRHHVPGAAAQRGRGGGAASRRRRCSCRRRCSRSCASGSASCPGVVLGVARGRDRVAARAAARRRLVPSARLAHRVRASDLFDHAARPASSRWCSRPASASPRCWPRAAAAVRRADVGMRRRAGRGRRVHGHGVLEAADDDLRRRLPADARGRGARRELARTSRTRCATARRSSRRSSATSTARWCGRVLSAAERHEGAAGRQPPRLPRRTSSRSCVGLVLFVWWQGWRDA